MKVSHETTDKEDIPLREMFGKLRQEMAEQMKFIREQQIAGSSGLVVPNPERETNKNDMQGEAEVGPEENVEDRGLPMEVSETEGDQGLKSVEHLEEFELDVLLGTDDDL